MFAVVVMLVGTGALHAQPLTTSLPDAPAIVRHQEPKLGLVDWTLMGSVVVTRALDWTSTEECIRRPRSQCREGELPSALVQSKAGFTGYELGITAVSVLVQYELTRHHRRKLAWIGQGVDAALVALTVANNYRLSTRVSGPGLTWGGPK